MNNHQVGEESKDFHNESETKLFDSNYIIIFLHVCMYVYILLASKFERNFYIKVFFRNIYLVKYRTGVASYRNI